MSSPSYGNTNTEASDSVARRGWLIPADSTRVLDARARWATTLVGKFVDYQKFSTRRVQREVQAHWDGGGSIRIERAKGLYLFHFEREDAKDLFLAGSPWNLCGALIILKALIPNTPLHEHRFDEIAVWIQLHRLPYEYFNQEDATLIARAAGPMVAVDWPPDGNRTFDYIRARVRINPFRPVVAGTYVALLGTRRPEWIPFSYEKIFRVCFRCGIIGHSNYMCNKSVEEAGYGVDQGFAQSALAPHLELLQQDHRALFDDHLLAWPNTNFNRTSHVQLVEVEGQADLRFVYHDRKHSMDSESSLEDLQALIISDSPSSASSSEQEGSNQPGTATGTPGGNGGLDHQSPPATGMASVGGGGVQAGEVDSALLRVATWLRQERAVGMPGCLARGGQLAVEEEERRGGGQLLPVVALEEERPQLQGIDLVAVVASGEKETTALGQDTMDKLLGKGQASGPWPTRLPGPHHTAAPLDSVLPSHHGLTSQATNTMDRPMTSGPHHMRPNGIDMDLHQENGTNRPPILINGATHGHSAPPVPLACGVARARFSESLMLGETPRGMVMPGFHMIAPSFPGSSVRSGPIAHHSDSETDPSEEMEASSATTYLSVISVSSDGESAVQTEEGVQRDEFS
ncbi:hypothetical protein RJ640_014226 [Escallonia rubra]|uniref:CCHC-type domain-containing protein n=1 Tax=Escallonia rubra TaxID=112253 RepID=A0AA88R9S9_9ASTE|nr:hypothetical protein RJ640_014226 [Escallonia rubra]